MFGVINVMAITQGALAAPPIQQVVVLFHRKVAIPGQDPSAEAVFFIEAPGCKNQMAPRLKQFRAAQEQFAALPKTRHMVQDAEKDD